MHGTAGCKDQKEAGSLWSLCTDRHGVCRVSEAQAGWELPWRPRPGTPESHDMGFHCSVLTGTCQGFPGMALWALEEGRP